jgi:hypothetical protein
MLNVASAEPETPARIPRPGLQELAEGCLRRNPYLALKNVSCDCPDGVLVLRGCVPTYHLKQVAQEAVAHLEGVRAVDNQIVVVQAAVPEALPDEVPGCVPGAGEGFGEPPGEASPDPDWRTGAAPRVVAPFGEQIEVDG